MVGLADKCIHPTRNEPYMKSHGGGRDNSPEGQQVARILSSPVFNGGRSPPIEEPANLFLSFHQGAFTHGFICEFQNAEDRKY
jgi:hypothetical protein